MSTTSLTQLSGESRVTAVVLGNIIPQVFGGVFVAARLYTKGVLNRSWGYDDSMLAFSYVLSIALAVLNCVNTKYGAGIHIVDVPLEWYTPMLKIDYATTMLYILVLSTTKTSICFFYYRIFHDRTSRVLSVGTVAFITLYTIPIVLLNALQCSPVKGYWDTTVKMKCLDLTPMVYVLAILNMVMDVWLIAIVVPRILPLNIAKRQKIALLMVVSSGWIVLIASILRIVNVHESTKSGDITWADYEITTWSAIEINIGFFCVSAPAVKPILERIAPNLMRSLVTRVATGAPTGGYGARSVGNRSNIHTHRSRLSSRGLNTYRATTTAGSFELVSHDTYAMNGGFWRKKDHDEVVMGDSESQEVVLRPAEKAGIMTSTSVTVVTTHKSLEEDEGLQREESLGSVEGERYGRKF